MYLFTCTQKPENSLSSLKDSNLIWHRFRAKIIIKDISDIKTQRQRAYLC